MSDLEFRLDSTAAILLLQAAESICSSAAVDDVLEPSSRPAADEGLRSGRFEPVEILGSGLRLSGTLSVGGFNRLSDFANLSEGLISLSDGQLMGLHGEDPVAVAPQLWLTRNAITLIAQREPGPLQNREGFRATRETRRLSIVSPGLLITGDAHLPEGGPMATYMGVSDLPFVPMTEVEVRSAVDPGAEPVRYAFALLNRSRIDVIAPAPSRVVEAPTADAPTTDAPAEQRAMDLVPASAER